MMLITRTRKNHLSASLGSHGNQLARAPRSSRSNICSCDLGYKDCLKMVEPEEASTAETAGSAKQSLASSYRTSTGIYQSLSLILNAALMVYAHVGLSAVFVSNQRQIGDAVASASTGDETTTDDGLACTESDQLRWTSIGPDGLTGANNKTYESSFCSTGFIDPDTRGTCLVTASCISKCFSTQFNYTEPCADCFAAIPLCSLTDGCTVCAFAPQSEECYVCTLR